VAHPGRLVRTCEITNAILIVLDITTCEFGEGGVVCLGSCVQEFTLNSLRLWGEVHLQREWVKGMWRKGIKVRIILRMSKARMNQGMNTPTGEGWGRERDGERWGSEGGEKSAKICKDCSDINVMFEMEMKEMMEMKCWRVKRKTEIKILFLGN
jgi:hypothetical protein